MLSTTDPRKPLRNQRGQALLLFAAALTALIGAGALAFDTGMMMLEKRTQQNAADAGSLAGARFLPGNHDKALARALAVVATNGYTTGDGDVKVDVTFPTANNIRVTVGNSQPSFFAALFGMDAFAIESTAVSTNESRPSGPFALLSLNETLCVATLLEGSGLITSNGNIQTNSGCNTGQGAFRVAGNGSLFLTAPNIGCNVVGSSSSQGNANNDCDPANTGATSIPDPYKNLPYPSVPGTPAPVQVVAGGGSIPAACPGGSSPATHAVPALCNFGGSYTASRTWRIFPGYYPGGINLQGGNFLMEPGIYYVADGGFRVANARLTTVNAGGTSYAGGVLVFNTTHASTATSPGQVVLQGGSAGIFMYPLNQGTLWDDILIFQDRALNLPVEIVGGDSTMSVRGIIYGAGAHLQAQGNAGTLTIDQMVGDTVRIAGNGGTINVAYNWEYLPLLRMAGLIE